MYRFHVIRACKWLLAHLVIAAAIGYLTMLVLAVLGVAKPATLLQVTTFGIRHVGGVVVNQGQSLGLDQGVLIFFCNLTVALLVVANVYWSRILNPFNPKPIFSRLQKNLLRDASAERLRKIPAFALIRSPQLLLTSFLLLVAPYIFTITLGFMAGALFGVSQLYTSSPLVALAYLVPHGIPEISALLLASSIPVGIWMIIRPVAANDSPTAAFQCIDLVLASQPFQQDLKMIINLLLIAGIVEAHLTIKVVTMLGGS